MLLVLIRIPMVLSILILVVLSIKTISNLSRLRPKVLVLEKIGFEV